VGGTCINDRLDDERNGERTVASGESQVSHLVSLREDSCMVTVVFNFGVMKAFDANLTVNEMENKTSRVDLSDSTASLARLNTRDEIHEH
jgi:hypothetical protein